MAAVEAAAAVAVAAEAAVVEATVEVDMVVVVVAVGVGRAALGLSTIVYMRPADGSTSLCYHSPNSYRCPRSLYDLNIDSFVCFC
jgi:hypothetical protein